MSTKNKYLKLVELINAHLEAPEAEHFTTQMALEDFLMDNSPLGKKAQRIAKTWAENLDDANALAHEIIQLVKSETRKVFVEAP